MPCAQGGNALNDIAWLSVRSAHRLPWDTPYPINLASMAPVLTQPCSTTQVFDALEKIFRREGIRIMTLLTFTR